MDCAAKLERDLAAHPGVSRVELNFAAAKLTVHGPASPEAVAAVGAQHDVQIRPAGAAPAQSFWAAHRHLQTTAGAGLLVAAGWVTQQVAPAGVPVALYAAAIVLGGWNGGKRGLRSLLRLDFNMNVLMTIAVTGAALIGQWSEAAVVAFLFGVSEALETYTMDRARQSLRTLMDGAPKLARVRRAGQETERPVEEISVGDVVIVRPGEKLSLDGTISAGSSAVNQAAITGESMPVHRQVGDDVFAGTLNGSGALEVKVTRLALDSTFARIVHLVEEAQAQRAPVQTFVDRFARVYTPAVMALALLLSVVPPLLFAQPWLASIYRGLSVLVVACPCALLVSTPVSIVSAISNAARHGVLIKGGAHLEQMGRVKAVAFDKTGTLTSGRPQVTDAEPLTADLSAAAVLSLAAAVEAHSEHPLAQAIVRAGGGAVTGGATDFQAIVGRGARALVDGRALYVGSPQLFTDDLGVQIGAPAGLVQRWQDEGKTVMLLGDSGQLLGAIAVADTVRASSAGLIRQLRAAGVAHTVMLTGDNARTARAIANAVAVDQVQAELLPVDKVAAVRLLAAQFGAVAMVGDGVNDAPALAAATVGIAMGGAGTDVARETADIVLMADDLSKLPFALRLGRSTLAVIRQNIGIALALKLLALLAVFPGWLTLWLAIVADMGATILVTLNGMRLLRVRPQA